jgi:hypothetical protein
MTRPFRTGREWWSEHAIEAVAPRTFRQWLSKIS